MQPADPGARVRETGIPGGEQVRRGRCGEAGGDARRSAATTLPVAPSPLASRPRALALLLWIPLVALSWGTLCLGSDGHLALEPSLLGRCVDGAEAPDGLSPASLRLTCAGCGPCLDVVGADAICPSRGEPESSAALLGMSRVVTHPPAVLPPREAVFPARGPRTPARAPSVLRC